MPHETETTRSESAERRHDAATVAVVVLAVLAVAGAVTWLGPVLKPFLVAVFLYYVARFGANMLSWLGLGSRVAYLGVLLCAVIAAVLVGQLVYRESTAFLRNWPKYETRITKIIDGLPQLTVLMPRPAAAKPAEDAATQAARETSPPPAPDSSTNPFFSDFFRAASKETLDYVFRHSLDFTEVFTLVVV